jgi:hypothetical protein
VLLSLLQRRGKGACSSAFLSQDASAIKGVIAYRTQSTNAIGFYCSFIIFCPEYANPLFLDSPDDATVRNTRGRMRAHVLPERHPCWRRRPPPPPPPIKKTRKPKLQPPV